MKLEFKNEQETFEFAMSEIKALKKKKLDEVDIYYAIKYFKALMYSEEDSENMAKLCKQIYDALSKTKLFVELSIINVCDLYKVLIDEFGIAPLNVFEKMFDRHLKDFDKDRQKSNFNKGNQAIKMKVCEED